jgi:hypothetical protein
MRKLGRDHLGVKCQSLVQSYIILGCKWPLGREIIQVFSIKFFLLYISSVSNFSNHVFFSRNLSGLELVVLTEVFFS